MVCLKIRIRLSSGIYLKNRHYNFFNRKAGTDKTTFLRSLKSNSLKRVIVVAPTGVAAINAKGVTIHSFFQMDS